MSKFVSRGVFHIGLLPHIINMPLRSSYARNVPNCSKVSASRVFIIYDAFGRVIKMKEDCASRMKIARAKRKGKMCMKESTYVVVILCD